MIDLSVLVCSIHTRYKTFGPKIQEQIWSQYSALPPSYQERIEIIIVTDNKRMILGEKRNKMVRMAQGRYVQFVDDDDRIEPDMFRTILDAIESDADVITFQAEVARDGELLGVCHFSKDFITDRNHNERRERLPNHICCVKKKLAEQIEFPAQTQGEDSAYAKMLRPLLRTQHSIDRVLYHYDFSTRTTETQYLSALSPTAIQGALVDVIIISNGTKQDLRSLTTQAVQSCLAGAGTLRDKVNVIVGEQQGRITYRDATTVQMYGEFNYNGYANQAILHGNARWIVVSNNDVMFSSGWLRALLDADYPVVCPKHPADRRQIDIAENATGWRVGRHFSGWCFMMLREIWQKIEGFDTSVSFWCSDDVVVEQLKKIGVPPMLVPSATVHHLTSKTLEQMDDQDELTWGQLDIFNKKFHTLHALTEHPQFKAWEARRH